MEIFLHDAMPFLSTFVQGVETIESHLIFLEEWHYVDHLAPTE